MFADNIMSSSSGDEMINKIMAEVDKNHDGCISHEEFNDAMTEVLRKSVKEMLEKEKY
jgi:Ca2+-binding EF-hand superfamily protein